MSPKSNCFNTGFFVMEPQQEEMFLSVTEGFSGGRASSATD